MDILVDHLKVSKEIRMSKRWILLSLSILLLFLNVLLWMRSYTDRWTDRKRGYEPTKPYRPEDPERPEEPKKAEQPMKPRFLGFSEHRPKVLLYMFFRFYGHRIKVIPGFQAFWILSGVIIRIARKNPRNPDFIGFYGHRTRVLWDLSVRGFRILSGWWWPSIGIWHWLSPLPCNKSSMTYRIVISLKSEWEQEFR